MHIRISKTIIAWVTGKYEVLANQLGIRRNIVRQMQIHILLFYQVSLIQLGSKFKRFQNQVATKQGMVNACRKAETYMTDTRISTLDLITV